MLKPPALSKRGRPANTPPREYVATIKVELPRCPSCGSTEVEKSTKSSEQEFAGETSTGAPYTHIITYRRCCPAGHWRFEKEYENRGVMQK